jgi:hypothetical protein
MRDSIKAQFEVLDERFRSCGGDEWMERLHTGCRWTEGPAYFPAGRYLAFSDIANDRILRWDETMGAVGVFRQPAGYANGHTAARRHGDGLYPVGGRPGGMVPPTARHTSAAVRVGQPRGEASPARARAYQDPVPMVTATSKSASASIKPSR